MNVIKNQLKERIIISDIYNKVPNTVWPVIEAKKILKKLNNKLPEKGYVLFATGYGPSGLPHIGTFGEVVRTTMVMKALEEISNFPTKLMCISDDMDGMRKIPDNIPNPEYYVKYMGLPLTSIPDPFGTTKSFAHNMNNRLCKFLDRFNFSYDFISSSESYQNGLFNDGILSVMRNHDKIMNIMLPTLRSERRSNYSPFMPICPRTGRVLQVPIIKFDLDNGTITYNDPDNNECVTVSALNGGCKLQWKVDFGMRWSLLDVDFEMYGKDHLVNGKIYSEICSALGKIPPHQMFYELFLDKDGQKISKSKGNGLTIDEWLECAPQETLSFFMYGSPQRAKKLYPEIISKYVDEYLVYLKNYCEFKFNDDYSNNNVANKTKNQIDQISNPIHYIVKEISPVFPKELENINYDLLVNLATVCQTNESEIVWSYIKKDINKKLDQVDKIINEIIIGAINYSKKYIRNKQNFRDPSDTEIIAINKLYNSLNNINKDLTIIKKEDKKQILQNILYNVAIECNIEVKEWFKILYEILLGQSTGPRLGSFIDIYGIDKFLNLIEKKIKIT
ncbi:lysine--tRNA ligase [Lyticum sinuosum]|uniref:Lysine--tRNA ligase n=1 Tax=Lyticum sinuosum TaxID=1332059 RepID=A0AAE4VL61_9RICK|nr:lysine--tRNA ligase [Lyticum sinuosum]MDZ5761212.1 Lysine--tRNA ligase [Lyticum sinuosum]